MKITSNTERVHASGEKIFSFITSFNKFGKMLPDKIQDWESGDDYCKFSIDNLVTITLQIAERVDFSKIVYRMDNDRNIPASITILLNNKGDEQELTIEAEMDIPAIFSGMVKKPLQDFVNMLALRIKQEAEK